METTIWLYGIFFQLIVFNLADEAPFIVEVTEESPVGSLISGVSEYLAQVKSSNFQSTETEVRYQLLGDDSISRLFHLHATLGYLRVAARIDRETICPFGHSGSAGETDTNTHNTQTYFVSLTPKDECRRMLNLLIVTQPRSKDAFSTETTTTTTRVRLHLIIRDINDNAPHWPQHSALRVSFVETPNPLVGWAPMNRPGHSSLLLDEAVSRHAKTMDRAVDPDLGMNGTVVYRLVGPGAEYFRMEDSSQTTSIVEHTGLSKGFESLLNPNSVSSGPLRIWPIVTLDRETEDFAGLGGIFNLTVVASDLGVPPKTGSTNLIINVVDVNDHSPVFHNGVYDSRIGLTDLSETDKQFIVYRPLDGNIRETVPVGSLIVHLNATDKDSGAHAQIYYDFCPCDRNVAWNYFKIDHHSGRVIAVKRLDYDNGPRQFQFKVIAKDGAPEPYTLTGTAIVEVTLTDENDEVPEIKVMLVEPSPVEDPSLFTDIKGSQHLDRGVPSIKMETAFLGEYTTSINENTQPETVVAYIQVSDRDYNGQDQVYCRLGPTDNFTLQLDTVDTKRGSTHVDLQHSSGGPTTYKQDFRLVTGTDVSGLVGSQDHLDRELTPNQLVTLTCTDSMGNIASVRIHVHLKDLNDNPPEFVNSGHFVFQVLENQELIGGKPVWLGRTVAVDKDQGENAVIEYKLDEDYSWYQANKQYFDGGLSRSFELDIQTGDLFSKVAFDRESAPPDGVYRLRLIAIDKGTPSLTGAATVEVYIIDVNDWAPQFTRDVYTFGVSEDTRIQDVIGSVEAVDRDSDSQGRITYHLLGQSKKHNNIVYRTKRSDREYVAHDSFDDPAKLHDKILNKLSKRQANNTESTNEDNVSELNVTAESVYNHKDEHILQSYDLISKPSRLSLTDQMHTELNYFNVDRLSGKIRLIRRLDRESIAFFSFEVLATDMSPMTVLPAKYRSYENTINHTLHSHVSQKSLSATATVVIAVTDVNDNAPVFRRPNTSTAIQLRLQETLGRQLLIVEATDADEGDNARVTYSIRSEIPRPSNGPGTGYFSVDETSGILFLAKGLNTTVSHRLVIEACDNGVSTKRLCTLSPSIRISVFDGTENHENGDMALYPGRLAPSGQSEMLPFDLDTLAARSAAAVQAGRRNEVVVVCLIVIFTVLLLATLFLVACLVHRRGARQWFWINRSSNGDSSVHGKDVITAKTPGGQAFPNNDPWLEEVPHAEQTKAMLDSKMDVSKTAHYGSNCMSNDLRPFIRENGFTGTVYSAYPSVIGMKFHPSSQLDSATLVPLSPTRQISLRGPVLQHVPNNADVQGGMMMRRSEPNHELGELLTQSSYRPPSPEYQSLDAVWHHFAGGEFSPVNRIQRYRNPVLNTDPCMSYTAAERALPKQPLEDESAMFQSNSANTFAQTQVPHNYYKVSETDEEWHCPETAAANENEVPKPTAEMAYNRVATLGRPNTSKGKRRVSKKDDSMHSLRAGDLALHSARRPCENKHSFGETTTRVEPITTESEYNTKSKVNYTYQAYREETFV